MHLLVTQSITQLVGSRDDTTGDEHIADVANTRQELGKVFSRKPFLRITRFILVTSRRTLACVGHVFLSTSRLVGVTAFWGNSCINVLTLNGQSGCFS